MRTKNCPQEEAVARAAGAGQWPEALALHAAECAGCREVAEAARWMQALAVAADGAKGAWQAMTHLPDAAMVWRRAALAGEVSRQEKIRTALEVAQIAAAAAAPIGLASWVVWNWYAIEFVAGRLLLEAWPQLAMASYALALASLAPAALTLVALALGYPLFAGE